VALVLLVVFFYFFQDLRQVEPSFYFKLSLNPFFVDKQGNAVNEQPTARFGHDSPVSTPKKPLLFL
jgi:hypothetical protein